MDGCDPLNLSNYRYIPLTVNKVINSNYYSGGMVHKTSYRGV